MGTKRIGLARMEALLENLKREIALGVGTTLGGQKRLTVLATANTTLTTADSGKLYIFNDADGAVLTLPDSGGGDIIGWYIDVAIAVTATSNAHKVICSDTSNEDMVGNFTSVDTDTSDAVACWPAVQGDGYDFVSFNGGTTGIMGTTCRITNIKADLWQVDGSHVGTGTVATPFGST